MHTTCVITVPPYLCDSTQSTGESISSQSWPIGYSSCTWQMKLCWEPLVGIRAVNRVRALPRCVWSWDRTRVLV